tara:strand:- start:301 stop:1407 length:1107 start_codon:yes stop_codon:yes gene_type:complete
MSKQVSKIKVAFVALTDYGNTMTYWSNALNCFSSGLEAKIICIKPHKYSYCQPHDIDLTDGLDYDKGMRVDSNALDKALSWLKECKYIIFAEEMSLLENPVRMRTMQLLQQILGFHLLEWKLEQSNRKLFIWHCGMDYRLEYRRFNQINPQYFDKVFLGADLFRFSPGDEFYSVPFVTYSSNWSIEQSRQKILDKFAGKSLQIFHAPSNHSTKGTQQIRVAIRELYERLQGQLNIDLVYKEIDPPVSNSEVIKMKEESHIYIDQFHLDIGGYGISSTEALAYGNIVLASIQNISESSLVNQCGGQEDRDGFPIIHTGITKDSLVDKLVELCQKPLVELAKIALESNDFYWRKMSPQAVASRLEMELTE